MAKLGCTASVKGEDVVKMIIQYLQEMGYEETVQMLQNESGIFYNAVHSKDRFRSEIVHGKWENVLKQLRVFDLPQDVIFDLYEHIVCELIELSEIESAKLFMEDTPALVLLKKCNGSRYRRLENLCQSALTYIININENVGMDIHPLTAIDIYPGGSKENGRIDLAERILPHLKEILSSRLTTMLQNAMKYQASNEMIASGGTYDILTNEMTEMAQKPEEIANTVAEIIELSDPAAPAYVSHFLANGTAWIVGYADGLIEVRNPLSGSLRDDLSYQNEGACMIHNDDAAVMSLCSSKDSETLVSGDSLGNIKVWNISTGKLIKTFSKAHDGPVLTLSFSADENLLLSGSEDNTARMHGMRSGSTLRKYIGHSDHVIFNCFKRDAKMVLTASRDGKVIIWGAELMKPLLTYQVNIDEDTSLKCCCALAIPKETADWNVEIRTLISEAKEAMWLAVVGKKKRAIQIIQIQWPHGAAPARVSIAKTIKVSGGTGDKTSQFSGINHIIGSPKGEFLYCIDEDGTLMGYDTKLGKVKSTVLNLHLMEPQKNKPGEILHLDCASRASNGLLSVLGNDGFGRLINHNKWTSDNL